MVIGGISWIIFGLSHLLFPTLLAWDTALSNLPPGSLFGLTLSNQGFIYLFNADLLLLRYLLYLLWGALAVTRCPCAQW
jgi:hypothetical protein